MKTITIYEKSERPQIRVAGDAYRLLKSLKDKDQEIFIGIFLDTRKRVISKEVLFIGTLDSSIVHPREIMKRAILNSAQSFIVCHNHPSGECEPSAEDIEITKVIIEAGKLLNIPLLDHIIVGDNKYKSLRDTTELMNVF